MNIGRVWVLVDRRGVLWRYQDTHRKGKPILFQTRAIAKDIAGKLDPRRRWKVTAVDLSIRGSGPNGN